MDLLKVILREGNNLENRKFLWIMIVEKKPDFYKEAGDLSIDWIDKGLKEVINILFVFFSFISKMNDGT